MATEDNNGSVRMPSLGISIIPIAVLILLMVVCALCFGDSFTEGPSQLSLLTATLVGGVIAMFKYKEKWETIENGILDNIYKMGSTLFIILMIGALTASWIQSGVVPTIIYYGLKIISPKIFLFVAFLFTGIISILIGSSWTTVGTIGIAMLSAGQILGFSDGWLAGAIISGAYMGDKLSPLSDTTNLSSSIAGVNLYDHIKYMLYTAVPTFILSAIIFFIAGTQISGSNNVDVAAQCEEIASTYNISLWLLIIPVITIIMICKKISPFITLLSSALLGGVAMVLFQPQIFVQIAPDGLASQLGGGFLGELGCGFYGIFKVLTCPVDVQGPSQIIAKLTSTSGMSGMMNTIWLVLSVSAFGGMLDSTGFLKSITSRMMQHLKTAPQLVGSTLLSCIVCNFIIADQYIAILLPGKMYSKAYKDHGFNPELLSRSLQDSATVTSVFVPWNTCGIFQSATLGMSQLVFVPYCFFNILSPIISYIVAIIGWKITRNGKPVGLMARKAA